MRKAVRAPSITKKGVRPARVSTPMPMMPAMPASMPPAPMKKGGAAKKMKKGGKAC